MTFDQVVVFHKIVQLGSFKSAAAEVHKTQPAISLAIKKLEEEMEVELFDRSSYRPVLTEHGKAFYERSLKILQGMHELEGLSQSFRNREEPEISLAIDGISPLPELLKVFKKFSERFPNTKLNLGFDILFESERKVQEREAEMGITHFISDSSSLDIVPITQVRMVPVMSAELHSERKVDVQAKLLDIDQIVVGGKAEKKGLSFGLLESGRKWRVTDNNFKREIIMGGMGWGHLPEHTISRELKEKKLIVLDFEQVHPRELVINLIRLKKNNFGLVARSLWKELASLHE
jgi:DNA-binding transcriptional LysR family regulator